MTLDKLILGVIEGDETVLDYLNTMPPSKLDDLFRPMWTVTRPVDRRQEKPRGTSSNTKMKAKDLPLSAKAQNLSQAQKDMLKEMGVI